MIKIEREDCPPKLRDSKSTTAYRLPEVVTTLWNMQNEKCCYCETKIPERGHQKAVDHFRPQSIFKYRVNDWENLLLACAECNGKKSDKFPVKLTSENNNPKVLYIKRPSDEDALLIDPTDPNDDPEDHLDFHCDCRNDTDLIGLIKAFDNSPKGIETISVVGLDEYYYTKMHAGIIFELLADYANLLTAKNNNNTRTIDTILDKFDIYAASTSKYTAVTRAFIKFYQINTKFQRTVN